MVQQTATAPGLQPGLVMALVATYLASLATGLCLGYPAASVASWQARFPGLSEAVFHLVLPLGAIAGTVASMFANRRLGRNYSLAISAFCALVSFVLLLGAKQGHGHEWMVIVGTLVMGAACGVVSQTAPAYLHELSHHERRGKIVSGHHVAMSIGLCATLIAGLSRGEFLHVAWSGACLLPFAVSAVMMCFVAPQSPQWLAETTSVEPSTHGEAKLKHALVTLHGHTSYAQSELLRLQQKRVQTFSNDVSAPSIYKPLAISLGLMASQQLTGINGLIANFYKISESKAATLAFSATHAAASALAPFLVDRFGRTRMLHVSSGLETIGLLVLGGGWMSGRSGLLGTEHENVATVVGLCVFIAGYSVGHGPVPWVMLHELLPGRAKHVATTASTSASWLFDSLATRLFTALLGQFGAPVAFAVFAIFVVASTLFVKVFVPETNGKTIEDLEALFRRLYEDVFSRHVAADETTSDDRTLVINGEHRGRLHSVDLGRPDDHADDDDEVDVQGEDGQHVVVHFPDTPDDTASSRQPGK